MSASECKMPSICTSNHQRKRVLVAGGAGFIGLHLCKRLLDMGDEVICIDNFFTSQRHTAIQLIEAYPNFELLRHDVTEPIRCEVDDIYNLACPASPIHYQYNPINTTKVNFLGALHLLGLARRLGAKMFQASTSEVYGDPEVSPQPETYVGHVDCTGVRACYDEGKRVAETLCFEYHRQHGVQVRVGRIFNTYGPGMHPYDGRVVSNFIMQALKGEDITVYGNGTQTRSFCYIIDLIDGIIRFMDSSIIGPLNLGNSFEMTILDLARLILRLTNSQSRIVFGPLPMHDPKRRRPDLSKARYIVLLERLSILIILIRSAVLDWTPNVEIEKGLMKTIEYFRNLDLTHYKRPTKKHRTSKQQTEC